MFKYKHFNLTDKQYNDIKKWAETHPCAYRDNRLCGEEISITFKPTETETIISVKCICGEKLVL